MGKRNDLSCKDKKEKAGFGCPCSKVKGVNLKIRKIYDPKYDETYYDPEEICCVNCGVYVLTEESKEGLCKKCQKEYGCE